MSIEALKYAFNYETNDAIEKLVLICLANHFNDSMGQAWPSVETVSKFCGCSRASTMRKLKQLEDKGIISRQRRFNKTNIVVILFSGMSQSETSKASPEVSQCDNNTYNNLTLINNNEKRTTKAYFANKHKRKELSDKQKAFAHQVADKMWNVYKAEGFPFQMIYDDVEAFFLSGQTSADWDALGNGLDNPKDRGWM